MKEQKQNNGAVMTRHSERGIPARSLWSELAELRRRTDDLFSQAFGYAPRPRLLAAELQDAEPEVDIHETDEALQVLAALPGYTIDQIDVQATSNSLTIEAERKPLVDEEKTRTHRDNGPSGARRFYFAYMLPVDIDPKGIKASLANGVLRLELPKTKQTCTKSVKVNVKSA